MCTRDYKTDMAGKEVVNGAYAVLRSIYDAENETRKGGGGCLHGDKMRRKRRRHDLQGWLGGGAGWVGEREGSVEYC